MDLNNEHEARKRFFQVYLGGFVLCILIMVFGEAVLPTWLFPYVKIGSFLLLMCGFFVTANRWAKS